MKRKLYISIIPNQPAGKKSLVFFILLFFFLSIFLGISLVLLVRLFSSSNGVLIRRTEVRMLQNENKILKKTEEDVKERFERTKKKMEDLDKTAKRIEPLLDIQKLPQDKEFHSNDLTMHERLDSLLRISKKNRDVFTNAFNKLMDNKKMSSSIPSIKPVDGALVKGFGNINDLFTDEVRFHPGITFFAMKGAPVYATANGSIIRKGMGDGIGLFIIINHGYGYITKYGHLRSVRVKEGDYVKRGDIIGYVGKTGRVTGPSLYYEVIMNGEKTDPFNFIFLDVETMKPELSE